MAIHALVDHGGRALPSLRQEAAAAAAPAAGGAAALGGAAGPHQRPGLRGALRLRAVLSEAPVPGPPQAGARSARTSMRATEMPASDGHRGTMIVLRTWSVALTLLAASPGGAESDSPIFIGACLDV